MAKVRTLFRCSECGGSTPKWAGRCSHCGGWNTLSEEFEPVAAASAHLPRASLAPAEAATPISDVDTTQMRPRPTGISEFDRVLGGGLVDGSVVLLGGEPGIGKSTLLLQLLGAVAKGGSRCLLVSGEESRQQVRLRAERLDALHPDLWLAAETSLPAVLGHIDAVRPSVLVVDSIQTLIDPALESAPGSVTQVRECAHALVRLAKERGICVVLVGHVTKDGSLAGPRVLEHIVDTVLAFEGDRHHALRLLRSVKHRFGATGELGLFEMLESGLVGVADPSALFLEDRRVGVSGSVVATAIEGQRPLLVEVQALVNAVRYPNPRRAAQGLDINRLQMLLAVLDRSASISLHESDVYVSAVGGVRLTEPASDLGVALAIASSVSNTSIDADIVAIGEVGLSGEVRQVSHLARRLSEAARLGFRRAIVPRSAPDPDLASGLRLVRVATIGEALGHLGLNSPGKRSQGNPAHGNRAGGRNARPASRSEDDDDRFSAPFGGSGRSPDAMRFDR